MFRSLSILALCLFALSTQAQAQAVCDLGKKTDCECSYQRAFDLMSHSSKATGWALVGSGGPKEALAVSSQIEEWKRNTPKERQGLSAIAPGGDAPLPKDADKVSTFRQSDKLQMIIFIGKGACLLTVVRGTQAGIVVVPASRYFLMPF